MGGEKEKERRFFARVDPGLPLDAQHDARKGVCVSLGCVCAGAQGVTYGTETKKVKTKSPM